MTAVLRLRPDGLHAFGRRLPCVTGRGGIVAGAAKREGDGATPAGRHLVAGLLYRADRIARPASWARPIGPRDLWSDAPDAPGYNSLVRAPYPHSAERLRRGDRLYDLVMVLDWNLDAPEPGRGSAIFIHRWRRMLFPTEGCLALHPADLAWLAARAAPGTALVVDQP